MTIVTDVEFNEQKHYLGSLCKREHDYKGTGKSLKFKSNNQCWHCKKEYMNSYDRSLVPQRRSEKEAQSVLIQMTIVDTLEYNKSKHKLGNLCVRNHNFRNTGKSLRYISNRNCFFCTSETGRVNYAENRYARLEQRQKFKQENYEDCLKRRRQYKKNNPEMFRDLNARYRQTEHGKETFRRAIAKYNKSEKGRIKARKAGHKRRAIIRSGKHEPYTTHQVKDTFACFGNACAFCGKHQSELQGSLEMEHVVPISKGGSDRILNIVPSCWSCNNHKRAKHFLDWYLKQNFATLGRLNKIVLHLGDEELDWIGLPRDLGIEQRN